MESRKINYLALLIIALFSLYPLLWFHNGTIYGGGDNVSFMDQDAFSRTALHTWQSKVNLGSPNLFPALQYISVGFFWTLFKKLGLSLIIINRLWAVFITFISGLSCLLLVQTIYPKNKIARFIIPAFYVINPRFLTGPFQYTAALAVVYAAMPVVLLLWIRGLRAKRFSQKVSYGIGIGLLSIFYAKTNMALPYLVSYFMVFIIFYLFALFYYKNVKSNIAFLLVTGIVYLLINSWWLLAFIPDALAKSAAGKAAVGSFRPGGVQIYEAFRFMGNWAFRAHHLGIPYFPHSKFYYIFPFAFLTYLIPIGCFAALLIKKEDRDLIIPFSFIALLFILLTTGNKGPMAALYNWLYDNLPGFWTFRSPYSKVTPATVLAMVVLLTFSMEHGYRLLLKSKGKIFPLIKIKKIKSFNILFIAVILLLILIISWPVLAFRIYLGIDEGYYRAHLAKIPLYWLKGDENLQPYDQEGRMFTFPCLTYGGGLYKWEHGVSVPGSVAKLFFSNPILMYDSFLSEDLKGGPYLVNKIYEEVLENEEDVSKILRLLSTKYLLQQDDAMLSYNGKKHNAYNAQRMSLLLSQQSYFKLKKEWGKLKLYEIEEDKYLPHIYTSQYAQLLAGGVDSMVVKIKKLPLIENPVLLLREEMSEAQKKYLSSIVNSKNFKNISQKGTNNIIHIISKNPAEYTLRIEKIKLPFWLVFTDNYHPDWQAFFLNGKTGKRVKKIEAHFIANGYANAWFVGVNEIIDENRAKIKLIYTPQLRLKRATVVTLVAIGASLCYLLVYLFSIRKRRGDRI